MWGVSVILPCLNEEKAIGKAIEQILGVFIKNKIEGEVIVVDNRSVDNSAKIAKQYKIKYVFEPKRGYGSALLRGFEEAKYEHIVMGDCDGSYDFENIPVFAGYLDKGYDLVIGNRFKGFMEKGAMSFLHKHFGNPFLSWILRFFFKAKINDAHSGFRAITKNALNHLNLRATGMEFASEMVIKAINEKVKIKEVPINYYKREGKSKLRSFSDGWRHLRFMLMYAPNYLFLIPGLALFLVGGIIMALFLPGSFEIFGIRLYSRPMLLGSFLAIVGYQIIILGIYAKTYIKSIGFVKSDKLVDFVARFVTFESGVITGAIILLISMVIGLFILLDWIIKGYPALTDNLHLFIMTTAIIGVQTIFSSFFLSMLLVEKR